MTFESDGIERDHDESVSIDGVNQNDCSGGHQRKGKPDALECPLLAVAQTHRVHGVACEVHATAVTVDWELEGNSADRIRAYNHSVKHAVASALPHLDLLAWRQGARRTRLHSVPAGAAGVDQG